MRKNLIVSAIAVCTLLFVIPAGATAGTTAGTTPQISYYGAADVSVPISDWSDTAGVGLGGILGVIYPYSEMFNFRAQAGFNYHLAQEYVGMDWTYSAIPIMALAEYHYAVDSPAYLLAGAGITILSVSTDPDLPADVDDSSSEFSFAGGVGYTVNEMLNIEAFYNVVSDADHVSLMVTYGF
jgi:opacity protein-like surface antigen